VLPGAAGKYSSPHGRLKERHCVHQTRVHLGSLSHTSSSGQSFLTFEVQDRPRHNSTVPSSSWAHTIWQGRILSSSSSPFTCSSRLVSGCRCAHARLNDFIISSGVLVHYGNPDWYSRHVIPVRTFMWSSGLWRAVTYTRSRSVPRENVAIRRAPHEGKSAFILLFARLNRSCFFADAARRPQRPTRGTGTHKGSKVREEARTRGHPGRRRGSTRPAPKAGLSMHSPSHASGAFVRLSSLSVSLRIVSCRHSSWNHIFRTHPRTRRIPSDISTRTWLASRPKLLLLQPKMTRRPSHGR
jgi:hypothetical protein